MTRWPVSAAAQCCRYCIQIAHFLLTRWHQDHGVKHEPGAGIEWLGVIPEVRAATITHFLLAWINSIGSSIVINMPPGVLIQIINHLRSVWWIYRRRWIRWPRSVRTFSVSVFYIFCGNSSSSIVDILIGTNLNARLGVPRWRSTFTLKRANPRKLYAKSSSISFWNSSRCSMVVTRSKIVWTSWRVKDRNIILRH